MPNEVMQSEVLLSGKDCDQGVVLSSVLTRDPDWLHVTLARLICRYSLRVGAKDVAAVCEVLGADLPQKIGETVLGSDLDILCLGPDEWMLLCNDAKGRDITNALKAAELKDNAGGISYALIDISHRNIGFTVCGAAAVSLINAGCPRDLSLGAFPIDRCARTVFEHAQIVLVREDEARFQIEIWRSFTPYLASYLATAARGLAAGKL